MEIHELNTFGGSLGAASYFAIDNGTDTGKISFDDLAAPLNERIDNIIAGPASSAQEVIDARLGADGTTYPSLGGAIRGQVVGLKNDLDSNFVTDNYPADFFAKRYINNSGNVVTSNASWTASDFIDISESPLFDIYTPDYEPVARVAFFNKNKAYISLIRSTAGSSDYSNKLSTITKNDYPDGAVYAQVFTYVGTTGSYIKTYKYSDLDSLNKIKHLDDYHIESTPYANANMAVRVSDKSYRSATGWYTSDPVLLNGVEAIKITAVLVPQTVYPIAFYDASMTFIAGYLPNGLTMSEYNPKTFYVKKSEFPKGSVYARICTRVSLETGDISRTEILVYRFSLDKSKGLKIMTFGDSIVSDDVCGIGTKVASIGQFVNKGNYAYGNASLGDYHDDNGNNISVESSNDPNNTKVNYNVLSNQVRRALAFATASGANVTYTVPNGGTYTLDTAIWSGTGSADNSPDVIYIQMGVNDGSNAPTSWDDEYIDNVDTVINQTYSQLTRVGIASALRWAIITLRAKFPNAEVFVSSPLQVGSPANTDDSAWRTYQSMKNKRDIIKQICEFESVHFVDAFFDSGASQMMMTSGVWTSDGVHPNATGQNIITRYIWNTISNRISQAFLMR